MDKILKVDEIFSSIQGESFLQGYPCVFVRLFGCNLSCAYCDTPQKDYTLMSAQQVYDEIRKLQISEDCSFFCITGGEPLLQAKALTGLIKKLTEEEPFYVVCIETNGTVVIPEEWKDFDVLYAVDIKTPSSRQKNNWSAIELNIKNEVFNYNTEFKFVVSNVKDVKYALSSIERIKGIFNFYSGDSSCCYPQFSFSPVLDYQNMDAQLKFANWLAYYLVSHGIFARLQVQLHKIIGVK